MVLFPTFFCLGNIGQENLFYDILHRENAFLGYKTKKVKKSKNWHFPKGLTYGQFWSKNCPFYNFYFLFKIGQENVFHKIQEQKNAFLGHKNKKFKKSKNWHFSQGVSPWFWSKNGRFSTFFFTQCRPGKCLFRYSTSKKRLYSL